jgi:eukaryotic-like serine/threonine-protein kinase
MLDWALRDRFEKAWREGRPASIEELLPPPDAPEYLAALEALVGVELQCAWRSWKEQQRGSSAPGEETIAGPAPLENYLRRFPELSRSEIVARLARHEWSLRHRYGEGASAEEYRRRFPEVDIPPPEQTRQDAASTTAPGVPAMSDAGLPATAAPRLPEMSEVAAGAVPPAGVAGQSPGSPAAGATLGNYELLGELGRGGMGVVYRARQRSANRIVALKVIRGDRLVTLPRDTQTSAIDRFRHEAQAAAQIEHDHIVTVYEVGEIDGQHFFSMRYVEGRSLAEILRGGPIANRQAAAYLEPVARAVHEAHLRGILHRDLKPQNILVDAKTDRALVADFGLAKLSEGQEELTQAGEVMGTPSYMSPEQARDSGRVAAATDVYALGATLYHVLTARPPFQAATPIETLRQVIDREPAPPRQLNPAIDRDLETICLKCLQKEPHRRYESAAALADDLARYLRGEPIVARPLGPAGRFWRWCRRNPVVAGLTTAAALSLLLALAATSIGYVTTSRALDESERRYRQTRQVIDEFFTLVAEDTLMNQPGMQPLRRELLDKALPHYRQFLEERGDDPTIRDELATGLFRVGRIVEEIDSPEKALPYYLQALPMQEQCVAETPGDVARLKALGDTLNALGTVHVRLGQAEPALAAYQRAIAVRRLAADLLPGDREARRTLANSLMNLGIVEREQGRLGPAGELIEEAQRIRRGLLERHPGDIRARRDLGMGHFNLANIAREANRPDAYRDALEAARLAFEQVGRDDPRDLANQQHLILVYRLLADLADYDARLPERTDEEKAHRAEQARWMYQKALDQAELLAHRNPEVAEYQASLAHLYMNAGLFHFRRREPEEALGVYVPALETLERLVADCPDVPRYRRDLAATLREAGKVRAVLGDAAAARRDLERSRDVLAALVEQFPTEEDFRRQQTLTAEALAWLDTMPTTTQEGETRSRGRWGDS